MKKIITLLLLIVCACGAKAQIITTIAGTGHAGYNGDNIAASGADIYGPYSVAVDKTRNLYIADYGNYRIRKVSPDGIITTIAGTGVDGFSGENVPATNAEISLVQCVIVDSIGDVFFSDGANNRVRKIDTSGTIITIAGNSSSGYNGDNMPATAATLWGPIGLAIDKAGNVYIADNANNRVRMVNTSGIITTIAGTGITGYSGDGDAATNTVIGRPTGLAIDNAGNIFIGGNQRIVKIENGTTIVTTYAGTGLEGNSGDGSAATLAQISTPENISIDHLGNIYFADYYAEVVRCINPLGLISTKAGNGIYGYNGDNILATAAQLDEPNGVAIDAAGGIYIADFQNNRVRYIRNTVNVPVLSNNNASMILFPDPVFFEKPFTIKILSVDDQQVKIIICNMLGEKIKEEVVNTNKEYELSINSSAGIYFVTAYLPSGILKETIVLQD